MAENARAEKVTPRRSRRKRSRLPVPLATTGTATNDARLKLFPGCAAVSFGAASLAGIMDIFDIDVIVQVLYWTLLGLIIGAAACAGPDDDAGEESGDDP
ncbi:MAG TPA: hypothetical protein VKA51_06015 [Rubrobacteraceae bacterium]|nr:hypothetical protein [Rubrobacteraceae bacterium]